ncbi:DNA methyltransferase [Mesorhizobium sp. KR1-2]|uniref:DNA methyltransferase n=1 Tax=Mesorhizobium sp. KR1-2 TaxID=3156609 RepID=UPI0032B33746
MVKPRAMLEDALHDISYRGEIVLDPFLGSGSTALAAETTGRRCRAVEIDGGYCDVAVKRWQAILSDTGESFAEVAERRAQGIDGKEGGDDQKA